MTTETEPLHKTCCSCKEEKVLEAFGRLHSGMYGRQHVCRVCAAKYIATHKAKNPTRAKKLAREYTRAHRCTPKGMLSSTLRNAKKRSLVFELTLEDFIQFFWEKPCHYCGETNECSGVDRVDNSLGYTLVNSVPCCKTCNLMKYHYTADTFLSKCRQIAERAK